ATFDLRRSRAHACFARLSVFAGRGGAGGRRQNKQSTERRRKLCRPWRCLSVRDEEDREQQEERDREAAKDGPGEADALRSQSHEPGTLTWDRGRRENGSARV